VGALAELLSESLETRVTIDIGRRRGKLVIEFASIDDLERIVASIAPEAAGLLRSGDGGAAALQRPPADGAPADAGDAQAPAGDQHQQHDQGHEGHHDQGHEGHHDQGHEGHHDQGHDGH
jgi:hypothetical protein